MTQNFPKRYEPFGGNINVKVELCNKNIYQKYFAC